MRTTPKGIIVWSDPTDLYDHEELGENFDLIDSLLGTTQSVEIVATLPTTNLFSGRLVMLSADVSGFKAWTICRYDGSAWKAVGPFEVHTTLPSSGNFAGRLIVLSSASGGFDAFTLLYYDGSAWKNWQGRIVEVVTALPSTNNFTGRLAYCTQPVGTNEAYILYIYGNSQWNRVTPRSIDIGHPRPASPYVGQIYELDQADSPFAAYDVIRWNGSTWDKVGPYTQMATPTYTTTIPSSPNNGDEIYYQADSTNSVVWHLRYNAGLGAFKWEFLGGSELFVDFDSLGSGSTDGTWYTVTSKTIPLAGDYDVGFGGYIGASSPGGSAIGTFGITGPGVSLPSPSYDGAGDAGIIASAQTSALRRRKFTFSTSGTVTLSIHLPTSFVAGGGYATVPYGRAEIRIRPYRVG
jgi:hypothetical protein